MRFPRITLPLACFALFALRAVGQSPNGNINGLVLDPSNRVVVGAEIIAVNDVTAVQFTTKSNGEGIYVLPSLPPGPYRLQVSKVGFKTIIKPDIVLNVQDALSINFTLPIGALLETLTVEGGAPLVNTESATVSTVVDRQFAENLPMNGRSFQTLIQLTPGVVVTPSSATDGGQFSVNGQRTSSNYWMVDGVGANIGVSSSAIPGNGVAGSLGSFSVLGGTNSLVSVDAMQEFRIQTSTYAPEFGRTPGAQVSIVTRSGTNQFHGTAFDYVRNDLFDANDWFNGYTNDPPLPKPEERQNDFGGTLSGPLLKDRSFFFFSYEGLRLRLPQVANTTVPDAAVRQAAIPAMQSYLNAFPMPNRSGDTTAGAAPFNASYSNPATLDAYSIRVDHRLTSKFTLFGRYNHSPSQLSQRGPFSDALNITNRSQITTSTATLGATWALSSLIVDDLRLNYSRTSAGGDFSMDDFGGAIPLASSPFPTPFTSQTSGFSLGIFSLTNDQGLQLGRLAANLQRQVNIVDSLSVQRGAHGLKVGVDFRRLSPRLAPQDYSQQAFFNDVSTAQTGSPGFTIVASGQTATLLFHNLGVFAQDTWRVNPRTTLTYGLRWDLDFVPSAASGPSLPAVTGYNLNDLSKLALAPAGTPPFKTTYGNLAPRVGVAYELSRHPGLGNVVRGGFGVFYDLATQQVGNGVASGSYPYGAGNFFAGGSFPLSSSMAAPPVISPSTLNSPGEVLYTFDPSLVLPYTLEWNLAVEQSLGKQQAVSVSYVGSSGRRLVQTAEVSSPNPNFFQADFVTNRGDSNYQALQVRFQRRLSSGLQALASYSWSHSIDTGSGGSWGDASGLPVISSSVNANRGPSDFDIRNSFSGGITYDVPNFGNNRLTKAIFNGWSAEGIIQVRSAPPVDLADFAFFEFPGGNLATVRPDLVPGEPLYLRGRQYPGGKAFNPNAFADPPANPNTGIPLRQGTVPRNFLRGFGATQWDVALHRNIRLHDLVALQFRAEVFNFLNHPNFGPPSGEFGLGGFGLASQMLGRSLSGSAGSVGVGALSPLYQMGGPRSAQFALKLVF